MSHQPMYPPGVPGAGGWPPPGTPSAPPGPGAWSPPPGPVAAGPGPMGPGPSTVGDRPSPLTPTEAEKRWLRTWMAVVVPGVLATRILKPTDRIGRPDAVMARVNRLRGWVGFAIVLSVFLRALYKDHEQAGGTTPAVPTPGTTGGGGGVPGLPQGMPSIPGLSGLQDVPTALPTGMTVPTPTGLPTGSGSATGTATATMAHHSTGYEGAQVVSELVAALVRRVVLLPLYGAVGVVLIGCVLVWCSHPTVRHHTFRQLVYPARAVLVFVAVPLAGFGVVWGCRKGAGLGQNTATLRTDGTVLQLVLSWVGSVVALWVFGFALVAIWQATKYLFSSADGHPMLPALVAVFLAWAFTCTDLFVNSNSFLFKGSDIVPNWIKALIGVSGSLVVTGLSVWELRRLHRWNGINWRSGPWGHRAYQVS